MLQLPIPSRPRCQLQLPHYYSARSLPKQPAPLWWEPPEGRGTASGAGHRRPPRAWDRCPVLSHAPGTDPHRGRGPSLGHQAPRGCSWRTRGSSTAHGASLSLCPGHTELPRSSTTGSRVSLRPALKGTVGWGRICCPGGHWQHPLLLGTARHHAGWAQGTLAPGTAASGPRGLGTAQPCQGAGKELQSHLLKLGMQSRTWEERGAACPPFQLVSMVNTLCTANVTIFPG